MKHLLITITIFSLFSCGGGPSDPPFAYQDNSRFIIEAITLNQDGGVITNQKVDLFSSSSYKGVLVKTVYSDASGKIFLSVPKGNYPYVVSFSGKKIISMQRFPELIYVSSNQNTGTLSNLNATYYDLGTVKLINN